MEMTAAKEDGAAKSSRARAGATWSFVSAASDLVAASQAAILSYVLLVAVGYGAGSGFVSPFRLVEERAAAFVAAVAAMCLYFLATGHYSMRSPFWDETRRVASASAMGLLVEGFLIYAHKADVSRASMFLTWCAMPFLIMWFRHVTRRWLIRSGSGAVRAVVFGRAEEADRAVDLLSSDGHLGFDVVATSADLDPGHAVATLGAAGATDAVVALSCADGRETVLAAELRRAGYNIVVIPPAMGLSASMRVQYVLGRDAMLLVAKPPVARSLVMAGKRAFDFAVALLLVTLLAVPMAVVAAVIACDGGSPFYVHRRIGRGGRGFGCIKFRSMGTDAEKRLEEYLSSSPEAREAWEASRKLPDDPRVTRVGRFIRKTSIDELPQLFNVLKGEMSLVGPRPVTESELAHYGSSRDLYTAVTPGLTGLWQVSGRSELTYHRRVALDAWYVLNWSPWHDIAILSKTVPVVLGRGGAY